MTHIDFDKLYIVAAGKATRYTDAHTIEVARLALRHYQQVDAQAHYVVVDGKLSTVVVI